VTAAYQEALAQAVKDGVITRRKPNEMKNHAVASSSAVVQWRPRRPRVTWVATAASKGRGPSARTRMKTTDNDTGGAHYGFPERAIRTGSAL